MGRVFESWFSFNGWPVLVSGEGDPLSLLQDTSNVHTLARVHTRWCYCPDTEDISSPVVSPALLYGSPPAIPPLTCSVDEGFQSGIPLKSAVSVTLRVTLYTTQSTS